MLRWMHKEKVIFCAGPLDPSHASSPVQRRTWPNPLTAHRTAKGEGDVLRGMHKEKMKLCAVPLNHSMTSVGTLPSRHDIAISPIKFQILKIKLISHIIQVDDKKMNKMM